jgi:Na+/proline symporter
LIASTVAASGFAPQAYPGIDQDQGWIGTIVHLCLELFALSTLPAMTIAFMQDLTRCLKRRFAGRFEIPWSRTRFRLAFTLFFLLCLFILFFLFVLFFVLRRLLIRIFFCLRNPPFHLCALNAKRCKQPLSERSAESHRRKYC